MRRKHDQYFSPAWALDELLKNVEIDKASDILEPCSGDGALSNQLIKHGYRGVETNDVDLTLPATTHHDYLKQEFARRAWAITNPPFDTAIQFLLKSMSETRVGVAFLLRLSFVEPTEQRGYWLSRNPPNVQIVMPRISFTGDGKMDSVTTAWFVWRHGDTSQKIVIVEAPKFYGSYKALR